LSHPATSLTDGFKGVAPFLLLDLVLVGLLLAFSPITLGLVHPLS
jgi:hypothetical protein